MRGQVADALGLRATTVAASLQAMVVDNEVVSRMYLQLGQAIGEL